MITMIFPGKTERKDRACHQRPRLHRPDRARLSKVILGEHEEDERILSQIEKAAVAGRNAFIDRFGI